MTEEPAYVEDAPGRGYAQGEIFLRNGAPDHLDALVYNTTGLNQCPSEQFDAIDVDTLATRPGRIVAGRTPAAGGFTGSARTSS